MLDALHGGFPLDALQLTAEDAEERAPLADAFTYYQTEQFVPERLRGE